MKVFRKYQFGSKSAATAKINALGIDEEGNELTAPVLSSTYHIDVLWDGEPVESWDSAMVWCAPMGQHTFGSSSAIAEWMSECKRLHPEYFPEPTEEDLV